MLHVNQLPRPIIAMTSDASTIRTTLELCTNELDHAPDAASLTLAPIALPDGSTASVRCSRSKTGRIRVSISTKAAK